MDITNKPVEQYLEKDYCNNYNKKSIIIIGAGPCGILSVKYLKDYHNVICIESRGDIGGQWLFESTNESNYPNLEKNAYYHQNGVLFSSLYENLRCNLPKFLMTYKGFPTKEDYDEFLTSQQFLEYLQEYSAEFGIKKRVLFNTYVSSVRLTKNLNEEEKKQAEVNLTKKFLVEIRSTLDYSQEIKYLQADSVVVATGHYSIPNYPQILNTDIFKGFSIHMHYFRQSTKEKFSSKHLVVYGCSFSAQDIIYILLRETPDNQKPSKITVIGNEKSITNLNKSQVYRFELEKKQLELKFPYIKEFVSQNSIELESGEIIKDVDCILYATGYKYSFPFLDNRVDNIIEVMNKEGRSNCFGPLYKRIFSVKEPNLIFLGTIASVISIQLCFERQVICMQKYLNGEINLPTEEEMLKEFNSELDQSNSLFKDGRNYFKMTTLQNASEIKYIEELSRLVKIPIDEEYQQYFTEMVLPLFFLVIANGNYGQWKQFKFSHLIPPNYTSSTNLF